MKKFFPKFVILIFSRPNSKRLKKKYECKVGKYDLIEIPIIRLKKIFSNKMIKLCVPTNSVKIYKKYSDRYDIEIFHGPEDDMMYRIIKNIKNYDFFIRVTGDDPLTSPELILEYIKKTKKEKVDYIYSEGIPDGLIPELVSKRYIKYIYNYVKDKNSTNFLTYYLIRKFKNFKIIKILLPYKDISNITLSIDYKKDLLKLNWLLNKIKFDININQNNLIKLIRKFKDNLNNFSKRKYFNLVTNSYDVRLKNERNKRFYY